jgi:hypothetical protein
MQPSGGLDGFAPEDVSREPAVSDKKYYVNLTQRTSKSASYRFGKPSNNIRCS